MTLPRVVLLSVALFALSYALHAAEGVTPAHPIGSPEIAPPRAAAGPPVAVCREVHPLPGRGDALPVLTLCEIAGGSVSGAEGDRWGPL